MRIPKALTNELEHKEKVHLSLNPTSDKFTTKLKIKSTLFLVNSRRFTRKIYSNINAKRKGKGIIIEVITEKRCKIQRDFNIFM